MTPVKSNQPKGNPAGPCLMVIFGASGDLTKRKVIPALYNLSQSGYLPRNFAVIGFAIDALNTEQFRELITKEVRELARVFQIFFVIQFDRLAHPVEIAARAKNCS